MKATGIARKIDEPGRLCLPMELRRTLGIEGGDAVEVFMDGDSVVLRKYVPGCVFCGNAKGIRNFKGKNVCGACAREVSL